MFKFLAFFKYKFKLILQNNLVAFLVGIYICLYLIKISKRKSNAKIKALVFSEKRWSQSLDILDKNKDIELYKIPDNIFNRINSLFRAKEYYLSLKRTRKRKYEKRIFLKYKSDHYYVINDKDVLLERKKQRKFIKVIGYILKKLLSIDCALTCSFYYNQEQEWAGGLTLAKISFITIHKEQSELDHYHLNGLLDNLEEINYKYQGDSIIVSNKRMEELFKKRNMFKNNKIIASGIMKYDFKKIKKKKKKKKEKKKIITLFSFFHYLSNIKQSDTGFDRYVEKNLNLFSDFNTNNKECFIKLFYNSHKVFILEALRNKNCIFYIKPRLYESWWIKRIKEIVKEVSGKNIDEINNLFITNKPAYDLINSSVNVIGFNSTVLIESVIQGCKPIIPIFDEAIGKHKKHVFFLKFLNLFSIASSEEKLSKLINFYLKKNNIKKVNLKNIRSFLNYYIYYTKPCSSSRTVQLIKKISYKYQ